MNGFSIMFTEATGGALEPIYQVYDWLLTTSTSATVIAAGTLGAAL